MSMVRGSEADILTASVIKNVLGRQIGSFYIRMTLSELHHSMYPGNKSINCA